MGLVEKSIETLDSNWRGIILDPLYVMAEPLAVTRWIPEMEEVAGAGKTETDAQESTRKFLEERVTLRYRREDEELAERKNISSRRPVSFRSGAGLPTLLGLVL